MGSSHALLAVTEKVKSLTSRRQHEQIHRDCRTVVQQLLSSSPQSVLMSTSFKQKEQEIEKQRKTVTFENPDQKWGEVKENPEQENLSGESDVEESGLVQEQDREDKVLSGEFRWMSRAYKTEPEIETCSVADSFVDNNSELTPTQTGSPARDQICQR